MAGGIRRVLRYPDTRPADEDEPNKWDFLTVFFTDVRQILTDALARSENLTDVLVRFCTSGVFLRITPPLVNLSCETRGVIGKSQDSQNFVAKQGGIRKGGGVFGEIPLIRQKIDAKFGNFPSRKRDF